MTDTYIFDTGSDLGSEHVNHLEFLLDRVSTQYLDAVGVRPGMRCLEVGAGGGSIARWLADRTGPTGGVVATDLDIDNLRGHPGVEVRRHDINDGVPSGGPYDLIHARLVLMHVPGRNQILRRLVDSLAPGGWLVLGECTDRPLHVLSSPTESDAKLFAYMQHLSTGVVSPAQGLSFQWAAEVPEQMRAAGLTDLHAEEYSQTTAGGTAGCLLHRNLNMQAEPLLRKAGATTDELDRYRDLLMDPRFMAWFYQVAYFRARRP